MLARNYRPGPLWLPGIIEDRTGPLSYVVKLQSGLQWKRHVDQLLLSSNSTSDPFYPPVPASSTPLSPVEDTKNREPTVDDQDPSSESPADTRTETPTPPPTPSPSPSVEQSDAGPSPSEPPRPVPPPRRSGRVRRPPSRLTYPPKS